MDILLHVKNRRLIFDNQTEQSRMSFFPVLAKTALKCKNHFSYLKCNLSLRSIFSVPLTDQQWLYASTGRCWWFGIWHAPPLVTSTFLAYAAGTRDLQQRILYRNDRMANETFYLCLVSQFSKFPTQPPTESAMGEQRARPKAQGCYLGGAQSSLLLLETVSGCCSTVQQNLVLRASVESMQATSWRWL